MSRVSQEQAEKNRAAIVEAASKLFREHGIEGVSVADVTSSIGLTHGGFYGHFASKEALVAEAITQAFNENLIEWKKRLEKASEPENALLSLVERYLSPRHRDNLATGCVIASLVVDTARADAYSPIRDALIAAIQDMVTLLSQYELAGAQKRRYEAALFKLSAMVGAIVLSRAAEGKPLSTEVLSVVKENLTRLPTRH